jgi:hypothetical protein
MLKWVDAVYIFDTGSVDATWDIVQDYASRDKRVVPLRRDHVFYSEIHLRGWIFQQARQFMRDGDWFLRVDADEFHHIPPPEFVKAHMARHETIAWHQYYNFQLTESEAAAWLAGKETVQDRSRPIEERRRWFTPSEYSEPRLCRYRSTMKWSPPASFPYNSGFVARQRLPIRHYPNRDPLQMSRRCRLRVVMKNCSVMGDPGSFNHWAEQEWRKFVAADNMPGLTYWRPGEPLPQYDFTSHLAKPRTRAIQRIIHAAGLPILDRLRPAWPEGTYPEKIPADLIARLQDELQENVASQPA